METPIESLPAPVPEYQARIYEDVKKKASRELVVDANVGALLVVRLDGFLQKNVEGCFWMVGWDAMDKMVWEFQRQSSQL